MNIKSWAEEDRPREKMLLKGKSALSDAELLAILIGTGTRNHTAIDLAKLVLRKYDNSIHKIAQATLAQLTEIHGIGEAKAISIMAACELARRKREYDTSKTYVVNSSKLAYQYMLPFMEDLTHEEFWVLLLNNRMAVIKAECISKGGITGTVVDARMVFKLALESMATSMMLFHNHPSGTLNPSDSDLKITKEICAAGKLLNINVLDHIIISHQGYYSFIDEGKL